MSDVPQDDTKPQPQPKPVDNQFKPAKPKQKGPGIEAKLGEFSDKLASTSGDLSKTLDSGISLVEKKLDGAVKKGESFFNTLDNILKKWS